MSKTYTSNKECQNLLHHCPSLNTARMPFWGRHIQLILYIIKNFFQKIFDKTIWQSEKCILEDGEEVILDWAFPKDYCEDNYKDYRKDYYKDCRKDYYKDYCEDNTPILMIHPRGFRV